MNKRTINIVISSLALATGVASAQVKASTTLTLGPVPQNSGYQPNSMVLSSDRPAGIKKEPTYRAKPLYGVLKVGNGPRSAHVIACDEPEGADAKMYIDLNGDGDLTNDGDGAWEKKTVSNGSDHYSSSAITFRASYGTATKETSSCDYVLMMYRTPDSGPRIMWATRSMLTGTIKVGEKEYNVRALENDGDGLFDKRYKPDEAPGKGVNLSIGTTRVDAKGTFELDGVNMLASFSPDGSKLTLEQTARSITRPTPVAAEKPKELLAIGTPAPDFTVTGANGKPMKLSDLKGKIVVIDLWATWCGPCQASMPHVQKVHEAVKSQGVYVWGINVWDAKKLYDKWVVANASKYTFNFAFDDQSDHDKSFSKALYHVSGIPTTYVIDKEGKVAAALVGYEEGGHALEDALAKLGVKIKE